MNDVCALEKCKQALSLLAQIDDQLDDDTLRQISQTFSLTSLALRQLRDQLHHVVVTRKGRINLDPPADQPAKHVCADPTCLKEFLNHPSNYD